MSESQINRFEDIPESYQEYIETIYRLSLKVKKKEIKSISNIAIAESLDIKPSSVTNMLRKLKNHGLINWKPRQRDITLTEIGIKIGKKLIYNHLLMESFLSDTLGIKNAEMAHTLACELEHHMREPIFNAFKNMIGRKAMKYIDSELDKGADPETIDLSRFPIIATATDIVTEFSDSLITRLPENEDLILEEKEKFLNEY